MAQRSVLVLVVLLCCSAIAIGLVDSASVSSSASSSSHHHQRRVLRETSTSSGESTTTQSPVQNEEKTCSTNTPCGWGVYTRFTRVIDYFMKNTCKCATGQQCIRVDDDVSVSAYVYKCRRVVNGQLPAS